jgi:PQQ-like domain
VVGDVVCLASTEGHFYALRAANGALAWDADTSVAAAYKRSWASDGGTVIVASDTTAPQAYDAATGTKGMSYTTQEPYVMALAAAGGILYALREFGDRLLSVVAATGPPRGPPARTHPRTPQAHHQLPPPQHSRKSPKFAQEPVVLRPGGHPGRITIMIPRNGCVLRPSR